MCAFPDLKKLRQQTRHPAESIQPLSVNRFSQRTIKQPNSQENSTTRKRPTLKQKYLWIVGDNFDDFSNLLAKCCDHFEVIVKYIYVLFLLTYWIILFSISFYDSDGIVDAIVISTIITVLAAIPLMPLTAMSFGAFVVCFYIIGYLGCALFSIYSYFFRRNSHSI